MPVYQIKNTSEFKRHDPRKVTRSAWAADAGARIRVRAGRDVSASLSGLVDMIDTIDRPGNAFAAGAYAGAGKYAEGLEDKPGKRIPKAGLYAAAGVGHARAEWSVFYAEAKGPNAAAGLGVSAGSLSAKAYARAELASASASAGLVRAKVGLAADTGVQIGLAQLEVKFLGTGISFGSKMGISLFGTEVSFNL